MQVERIVKITSGIISDDTKKVLYNNTTVKIVCDNINDVNTVAAMFAKDHIGQFSNINYFGKSEIQPKLALIEGCVYGYRKESRTLKGVKSVQVSYSYNTN